MFEEAVLRILEDGGISSGQFMESKARRALTHGRRTGVIPDGVGNAIDSKSGILLNKILVEVKAVNGTMTLSYSEYQLLGLIDVAARQKVGDAPANVAFVTTANTYIGYDVISYANDRGVFLTQSIAEFDGYAIRLTVAKRLNMFGPAFLPSPTSKGADLIGPPRPDNDFDKEEVEDLPY